MMKTFCSLTTLMLVFGMSATVNAQDEMDVTMTLVTDDMPIMDTISREISLPEQVSDRAGDQARQGISRANVAAEDGRSLGERMAEQAQGMRENAGSQVGQEAARNARERLQEQRPKIDTGGPELVERPSVPEGRP